MVRASIEFLLRSFTLSPGPLACFVAVSLSEIVFYCTYFIQSNVYVFVQVPDPKTRSEALQYACTILVLSLFVAKMYASRH